MSTLVWLLIITAASGVVGTGLGGAVGAVMKRDSKKLVSLLLSFAGGVMLAVVCFDLIPESFESFGSSVEKSVFVVVLGTAIGYGVVSALNAIIDRRTNPELKHIDKDHPKTADDLDELIHSDHLDHHRSNNGIGSLELFVAGIIMALSIALHNVPEGMVIGASYAVENAQLFSGGGFLMALVIGLHNIPEGMAVSVPLIAGGMKRGKAVLITALSGAPTIIGAVIGYYLGTMSPVMLTVSLSFAGGAMLYVVLGELLPESILMWKSKLPSFFMLIGILCGFVLVKI